MKVKELVLNKNVEFMFYQREELWYKTDDGFEFPVPVSDVGDGRFLVRDKAIYFMRWIKKHLQTIDQAKQEQAEVNG